ncbi:MAG: hypothetical protein ABMB14_06415 [Myxococcota bacterium]
MAWRMLIPVLGFVACDPEGSSMDPAGDPTVVDPTVTDGSDPQDPDGSDADPTWYQDVAPLLADRCSACHRAGGIGPFSVETYEAAVPWGPAIGASIESGSMPPFYAVDDALCDTRLDWVDDPTLSDAEKQLVYDWVDADMPEGDPATAVPAVVRPPEDLSAEEIDVELPIQEPFAVEGDGDIYECFRIPMPNTERRWITALQVVPDNELVVHHVLVWNDPNDTSAGQAGSDGAYGCSGFPDIFPTELVGTWTPGAQPVRTPPNTGTPVEVGASLVLNVHYHPTGTTTEFDRTTLRIQWTDQEPEQYASWFMVDVPFGAAVQPGPNDVGRPEFRIPAGVPDHVETVQMWFTSLLFSADMTVFAITPHMHYLGTDMLVTIDHTDDLQDDCLVHTPGFRFDFQRDYTYDASTGPLPVIHRNDRVRVQCMYDNSESNPYLPLHLEASGQDAPHDVWWGEETSDEMCMAIIGLIVPKEGWSPFSWF